jgi:hypothetical protein
MRELLTRISATALWALTAAYGNQPIIPSHAIAQSCPPNSEERCKPPVVPPEQEGPVTAVQPKP